jgi:hypothetical protein
MVSHSDSALLGTTHCQQDKPLNLLLQDVRQEMAIVMLEGLQHTADACTEICMRAVQEERHKLKVRMAQEELLYSLRDEHRRFVGALKRHSEVRQPSEAKVFSLAIPEFACSEVASPSDVTEERNDLLWDVSWSALPNLSCNQEVGVQTSDVDGNDVGIQAEENVHSLEVGVQTSETADRHEGVRKLEVDVETLQDLLSQLAGVQKSENLHGSAWVQKEHVQTSLVSDPSQTSTVSSVSSFGMVLEAQAKLRDADELMRQALNVREKELGLGPLAMSAKLLSDTADHCTTPFGEFEEALRMSKNTRAPASPSNSSRRPNISIDNESQILGSSDEETGSRQPGEEPSPNNSGGEEDLDDLSVAVAYLQMHRREVMKPNRAKGLRYLNDKVRSKAPNQKPLPARAPAEPLYVRGESSPCKSKQAMPCNRKAVLSQIPPRRKGEPQYDSETEISSQTDLARLRGPFRAGRGVHHGLEISRRRSAI